MATGPCQPLSCASRSQLPPSLPPCLLLPASYLAACLPAPLACPSPAETPTRSDPYSCDYDPATGAPFPRITHMEFYCDADATGFATFYEVAQNATDGCDYTLRFKTSAACIGSAAGGISGGWVFNIIVSVAAGLYLSVGAAVTWKKEGVL